MAIPFNQTDALTTLAHLLGERSVNATTTSTRGDFIQETLNEAYQAYNWKFAERIATLSVSGGIATLPTLLDIGHAMNVKYFSGTQEVDLDEIDIEDRDQYADGQNRFYTSSLSDGRLLLNTKDTAPSLVIVKYQEYAPIVAASVATPYPSKMTIALGARRYVKLGQNPDADISQDEKIFQKRLAADIAAHQVPAARKKRKTRQDVVGSYTGKE